MRRFERMAEEKKRGKIEKKLDLVVSETEEITVTSKTEVKDRART